MPTFAKIEVYFDKDEDKEEVEDFLTELMEDYPNITVVLTEEEIQ